MTYLLWSFLVVAFEKSNHYVEAAVVTGVAVLVMSFVVFLPGSRRFRLAQRWAAGDEVDRAEALQDTYTWNRAVGVRALWFFPVFAALLLIGVGVIAGASGSRLVQYGIIGAAPAGIGMAGVFGVAQDWAVWRCHSTSGSPERRSTVSRAARCNWTAAAQSVPIGWTG